MKPWLLHRIAIFLAVLCLVLCLPAIASQIGIIALSTKLFIALAVIINILWCGALCCLTKARGYHPLWGLTLLFPPTIIIYNILFPDKNKGEWDGEKDRKISEKPHVN
jgi:hypothetical protein